MNRKHLPLGTQRALATACAGTISVLGEAALAQDDLAEPRGTIRVEVTGSNILRSDIESALPVQVVTRDDIERSGSVTVAELMSKVSANVLGLNDQVAIGNFANPGLSSINLRGIGSGNTLVLLNGRRVANYAFDGSAVDVNSIPLAAVDRVEILKDGASAVYGTDAVAGVVNFILRKNFTGIELTGYGAWPEQGGGEQYQAVASAGFGDLGKDRYNVFVTASYQKDEPLYATDRSFSRTGYLPDEGIIRLPPTTFPSNIFYLPTFRYYNPSFANGCTPPASLPATAFAPGDACGFDFTAYSMSVPEVERAAVYGRATVQASSQHQLFAELAWSDNRLTINRDPTPVAPYTNPNFELVLYPAGGPFYPTAFAEANGISGDLNLEWRTVLLGARTNEVDTSAWRAVLGAEGTLADWDYAASLTYSRNDQSDSLTSGHLSLRRLQEVMATGLVNPFGPSGPEGDALLASTQVSGEVHSAKGTTVDFLGKASRETIALPGGPLALAIGAEARRERLSNEFSALVTEGDIPGISYAAQPVSGSRSAQAVFVEASVPFAKGFEAQLAGRYDHYSDFGSTWNPKVALRWQPMQSFLLRTSWGTGFRAPPIYALYTPQEPTFLLRSDPVRCPVTNAPQDCGFLPAIVGGNPQLQPETSEQFNAGVVWEPLRGLSTTVDYWKINKYDLIGALQPATIFNDFALYAPTNIVRGAVDPQYPDLPGPISNVILTNQNLGNLKTSGIDVDIAWRGPATGIGQFSFALNGTYIAEWKMQPDGATYESAVGRNAPSVPGPFPRWKHYVALSWQYGAWGATLAQTFQSGYEDTNDFSPNVTNPPAPRRASSYDVWDLQGRYSGFRNTTVVLGAKNLFDRDPPFTNQPFTYQVGYDPSYADPRGRTFYAKLTYAFK